MIPPALVICFHGIAFDEIDKLRLNNASYSIDKFIGRAYLTPPQYLTFEMITEGRIFEAANLTKFVKQEHVCYQVSIGDQQYDHYRLTSETIVPFFYGVELKYPPTRDTVLTILLIQSDKKLYGPNDNFLMHNKGHFSESDQTFSNAWAQLSYQQYKSQLLEAPYETNCLDYRKQKFESRNHCYDECLLRKFTPLAFLLHDILIDKPYDLFISSNKSPPLSLGSKLRQD